MKSVDASIQALSRAVLSEARAEAEQIVADATAKADAIRQRAQEQAAAEREKILEQACHEAERIRSQAIAAAQLRARTLQLERREKLLDGVFDAARQRLPSVRQWTDYEQIVRRLIREAVAHLETDVARIRADAQTRKLLSDDALAELSKELGVQLQLGTPLEHGTGVIAETTEGHRQYDNTLEARLSRRQDALRSPVHRLLMGESL
ncbi:MAG: V-type ATP synthase subunit E family protein [Chloroflexota bacterium]|nr:V-type ATP synthase subunit E family protein [Chloroflexota bacterium]